MKKMRKGKKMLLILLIAIVVIAVAILIINVIKNREEKPETPVGDYEQVIPLPQTTYSNMEVRGISVTLLEGNAQDGSDQTRLSMEIHNTTSEKVENESVTAVLLNSKDEVLSQMTTWISILNPGEQHDFEVILPGDLTDTAYIKLVKN